MATPLSADRLLAALKSEGVRVVEHVGWRTRNRNHRGPWGGVNGVVIHHTAGRDSLRLVIEGTADLPGPLCHTHLSKSGLATMVGHGRANHAGTFAQNAHDAVVGETGTHPRPDRSEPVDGNAHYYGIEIENLGDGNDPYPPAQYDAAVRWAAAICRAHGWTEHSVIGHKEGTRRKIDPSFDMNRFRAAVRERLAHAASWDPADEAPPQEDDMPTTLGRYDGTDRPLTPGKWKTLDVEGVDLATGARAYTATVLLTLDAPAGATVQGRFYHHRPDGSRWTSGVVERTTTSGQSFPDFTHSGSIRPDERLRFEVAYWPTDTTDTDPITITAARARGLYWK